MFKQGHLTEEFGVASEGNEHCTSVRWHLKLVALVSGLGGASSGRPCFLCLWERANPTAAGAPRTLACSEQLAEWSQAL